jgi:hypothetical protein
MTALSEVRGLFIAVVAMVAIGTLSAAGCGGCQYAVTSAMHAGSR